MHFQLDTHMKQVFNNVYNNQPNFITPTIRGYFRKGKYIAELSSGKFLNKPIIGVTVLEEVGDGYETTNLSNSFPSINTAMDYINQLEEKNDIDVS